MNALLGLWQFLPSLPHACGISRFCDSAVLPVLRHAPGTGNTEASYVLPAPLGGRIGAKKGGVLHKFKNRFSPEHIFPYRELRSVDRLFREREINGPGVPPAGIPDNVMPGYAAGRTQTGEPHRHRRRSSPAPAGA